jgi:hypothetical protein
MTDVGKNALELSVVVGVTEVKSEPEAEVAGAEIGVDVAVPFRGTVGVTTTVGEESGVVTPVALTVGVVIGGVTTVVGVVGGVEVPFTGELVMTIVPDGDEVGGIGVVTPVPEIIVVGGDVGVTIGVVVGALEGVVTIVPMILVSDKMLERRLASPVLLVAATGVVAGVTTPVEAAAVMPVAVGVSVEAGGRRALVTTDRMEEIGFVPTTVVAAALGVLTTAGVVGVVTTAGVVGVLTTAGVVGVLTTVGVDTGVEVPVNRPRILVTTLLSGSGSGLEAAAAEAELVAAAVAVDPPLPENVTPDVMAELVVGLEGLVVVPLVETEPGQIVIAAADAEADDGISTVVAAELGELAGVGLTTTSGTEPLEAAEEGTDGDVSNTPAMMSGLVELAVDAAVGPPNGTVVV